MDWAHVPSLTSPGHTLPLRQRYISVYLCKYHCSSLFSFYQTQILSAVQLKSKIDACPCLYSKLPVGKAKMNQPVPWKCTFIYIYIKLTVSAVIVVTAATRMYRYVCVCVLWQGKARTENSVHFVLRQELSIYFVTFSFTVTVMTLSNKTSLKVTTVDQ